MAVRHAHIQCSDIRHFIQVGVRFEALIAKGVRFNGNNAAVRADAPRTNQAIKSNVCADIEKDISACEVRTHEGDFPMIVYLRK